MLFNPIIEMLNQLTPYQFETLSIVFNHYKSTTEGDFEIVIKVGEVRVVTPFHNLGVNLTEKILKDEGFYKGIFNEIWEDSDVNFIGVVTKEGDKVVVNLENEFTQFFGWYDEEFVWVLDCQY